MQQFNKFSKWSGCNHLKRKWCAETCLEKLVKSHQVNFFVANFLPLETSASCCWSKAFKTCQIATIQVNFTNTYFGSKFLAAFWHLKPLCGVVAATLSTLSSRLLAFKGCCACDTLVGLQAFRLNEEACRQQFLLLFSAFLVWIWTKMSYNSPSPRTSNSRLYSSSGVGAPLPPQLVTSQRLQNISDSTISISKV